VPHAATEIAERRMQQQVDVIAHQAIGMRLDSEPVEQVSQQLKKLSAMRV